MSEEEVKLLDSLSPSDIGWDTIAEKIIRFEGFTDACWEAAFEEGKAPEDLELEIICDWAKRGETRGLSLLESGWWTPDMFFAIYRR